MNKNLLKAKMVEKGKTQAILAKELGMSVNALCRKLNGRNEFTLSEVINVSKVLGINTDCTAVHNIFLS